MDELQRAAARRARAALDVLNSDSDDEAPHTLLGREVAAIRMRLEMVEQRLAEHRGGTPSDGVFHR